MVCRECGECHGTRSGRCPGPACALCDRTFDRRNYNGNLAQAQRARDQHQSSHPTHLSCSECSGGIKIEYQLYGNEAITRATQERDDHQKDCTGWPCPHCSRHLRSLPGLKKHEVSHWDNGTYRDAGRRRKDDEHAILLGATFADEFCLVAWHCEEKRLFRVIGRNKFWSREDFEELKIQDGDGFRFRRHTWQGFDRDWQDPHARDNIRVFDISPAHVKKSINVSQSSVKDLLKVDAFGPYAFCDEDSSFALLNVTNLKFYEQERCRHRLRCSFRDSEGMKFTNVPVVNYHLGQLPEVPFPSAAATTVVLGLSCNGYRLMLDAWLPEYQ